MPLTRIKTKGLGTSVTFENITDTGTEGTKVATGTTAPVSYTHLTLPTKLTV